MDDGWEEIEDPNSDARYFWNPRTGETAWHRPSVSSSRPSSEPAVRLGVLDEAPLCEFYSFDSATVWIPSEEHGFVPAFHADSTDDGSRVCALKSGERVIIPPGVRPHTFAQSDLRPIQSDLLQLPQANEAWMLYTIAERFRRRCPYTSIGGGIVVIHPCVPRDPALLPHDLSALEEYSARDEQPADAPHLVVSVQRLLAAHGSVKCLTIQGASGSGKTAAFDAAVACVTHCGALAIELAGVAAVLDGFAHAKALANNNSSRFGRMLTVDLDPQREPVGASLQVFSLEMHRVTHTVPMERNYNIFYQLVRGSEPHEKARLGLKDVADYPYLTTPSQAAPSAHDAHDGTFWHAHDRQKLEYTKRGLDGIGVGPEAVTELMQLVAAILQLGALQPTSDLAGIKLRNQFALDKAAELLQIDKAALQYNFGFQRVMGVDLPLDIFQASHIISVLSKRLYAQAFAWLVDQINRSLHSVAHAAAQLRLLELPPLAQASDTFDGFASNFMHDKLQVCTRVLTHIEPASRTHSSGHSLALSETLQQIVS
jgi:myosin heavy subunit